MDVLFGFVHFRRQPQNGELSIFKSDLLGTFLENVCKLVARFPPFLKVGTHYRRQKTGT